MYIYHWNQGWAGKLFFMGRGGEGRGRGLNLLGGTGQGGEPPLPAWPGLNLWGGAGQGQGQGSGERLTSLEALLVQCFAFYKTSPKKSRGNIF